MLFRFVRRHPGVGQYMEIDQFGSSDEVSEKDTSWYHGSRPRLQGLVFVLSILLIVTLAAVLGFFCGTLRSGKGSRLQPDSDTVYYVPVPPAKEVFRYNSSFAAVPPHNGEAEPLWDSLIPNGLGYVKVSDSESESEPAVLSVFHQLHCLYTIRRVFYTTSNEMDLEAFDLGKERPPHIAHCFDYLRQGILCSADSSVEPAVDLVNGFLGAGFARQCRDYTWLKAWAERHRVFDAHGFLGEKKTA